MNDDFKTYRLQRGYSVKTIKSQDCYIRKLTCWLNEKKIALLNIDYQTLLSFVSVERKKGSNPENLKNQMQAIRIYLDYLKDTGIIKYNPAEHVKIRDTVEKMLFPAIEEETLLNAYKAFANNKCKTTRGKAEQQRDTVALGLMVFQGLDSGDLERLTVKDINLTEGTLYVASSRRNASRTLKLESLQILSINEYLTVTRNCLNEYQTNSEKLFVKQKINDMVSAIVQKLKAAFPEIQNPRHIHSSVIQNRLKQYHIRQVQYMSGHRHISSTEKYKKEDLHDLQQQITKYHPIK